ncbi:hypothetical protein HNV11_12930 [Spirosoma taeanense]|uniref:HYR domain-containing protein n=1 Tax=Spirosoma taeanense TaxID=2735870 RepID=A0A6M5Y9N8_9BACT|nr:LamG-like jellyroll fold domain-containing protein [Spirosoma taeanense]QJW90214.1 hypothetical protein HNV11_12930 [Spirosoma taeanense]
MPIAKTIRIIALALTLISQLPAYAIDKVWTNGSGDGKWSTAANWSPASVPGSADRAVFNGTSSANCTIDVNPTIQGIATAAEYGGTVFQGASTITISVNFTVAGVEDFNAGTGLVLFKGGVTLASRAPVYKAEIDGSIFISNNLKILNDLTITAIGTMVFNTISSSGNSLLVEGDVIVNDPNGWQETGSNNTALSTLSLVGSGDQTIRSTTGSKAVLTYLIVNKNMGNVLLANDLEVSRQLNGSASAHIRSASNANSRLLLTQTTLAYEGDVENVEITGNGGIGLSTNFTVLNELTLTSVNTIITSTLSGGGGALLVGGNVMANDLNGWGATGTNNTAQATLNLVGGGDQIISSTGSKAVLPQLNVSKSGGNVLLATDLEVSGRLSGSASAHILSASNANSRLIFTGTTLAYQGDVQDVELAGSVFISNNLKILNDLTITAIGTMVFNTISSSGNSLLVEGDVIANDPDGWAPTGSNNTALARLQLTGSGDQTISGTGRIPQLYMAKPSGKLLIPSLSVANGFNLITISNGAWDVSGYSVTSSGGFTSNGGKIIGTGTLNGAVTCSAGGGIAPGNGAGCLTINGNLSMGSGSALTIDIADGVACINHDQLVVNGSANINGATLVGGTVSRLAVPIKILENDGTDATFGTFTSAPNNATITLGGTKYIIKYNAGSNDITLEDPNPNKAPTAVCKPVTVAANGPGCTAMVNAQDFSNGSSDPEGGNLTYSVLPAGPFAVGTTTVTLTVTDPLGATANCQTTVTVQNATEAPLVNDASNTFTYNGSQQTATAAVGNGATVQYFSAPADGDPVSPTATNAGTYTYYAQAAVNGCVNPNRTKVTLQINKANPTVDVAGYTGVYDGQAHGATGTAKGVKGETLTGLNLGESFTNVPGGSAAWSFTDASGNYTNAGGTATITISQAPLTIVVDNKTKNYGQDNPPLTGTVTGLIPSDGISVTYSTTADKNSEAKEEGYPITATLADPNNKLTNYSVSNTPGVFSVVGKANQPPVAVARDITIALDANGKASITPDDIDGGSTDDQGITNKAVSNTTFGCNPANYALAFNGTNPGGYFTLPAGVVKGLTNFTFEAWVNYQNNGAWSRFMDFGNNTNVNMFFTPASNRAPNAGNPRFAITIAGASNEELITSNMAMPTGWHHVAVVLKQVSSNSVIGTMYIDGNVVGTNNVMKLTPNSLNGGITNNNYIGRSQYPDPYLKGQMDEVRIWSVARSAADINTFKNKSLSGNEYGLFAYYDFEDGPGSTKVKDKSPSKNDGTLFNMTGYQSFVAPGVIQQLGTGVNSVTLTVSDAAGLSSSAVAKVTVVDNIAPTLTAVNKTVALVAGSATIQVSDVVTAYSDNCGVASLQLSKSSFDCSNLGENTITVSATDVNGKSTSVQVTITVTDPQFSCNKAPVAVAKPLVVPAGANCQSTATAAAFDNGSSDPDNDALTFSVLPAGPYALGVTNVVFTVTDARGAKSSQNTTVTVEDKTAPTFNAPADRTVSLLAGCSFAVPDLLAGLTGSDNCSKVSFTQSPAAGTSLNSAPGQTHPITITAKDEVGNSIGKAVTLTAQDEQKPVVAVQNLTLQLDATGKASIMATQVNNGSSDNCTDAASLKLSLDKTSFDCSNLGPNSVTLTVTDASGNSATAEAVVTVEDKTAPVITPNGDKTVATDAGQCSATVAVSASATDNCSVGAPSGVRSDSKALTDAYPVGKTTIVWSVTDANGIAATNVTQTIVVEDKEKPLAKAQNLTVQLDAAGKAAVTASQLNNNSSDACGIQSMSLDKTSFDCVNLGQNTVTLTVTDIHGNQSTATAVVTVEDKSKPVTTCPADEVKHCFAANNTYQIPALVTSDNCGIASVSYVISGATTRSGTGSDASGVFQVGTSTIQWTVTDQSGNQSQCSGTVVINASLSATLPSVNPIGAGAEPNTIYVGYGPQSLAYKPTVSGGTAPYSYKWSNGSTGSSLVVTVAGDYSVTITDARGCVQSTSVVSVKMVDVRCGSKNDKVIICQKTGSDKNPWNQLCVDENAVAAHLAKGDKLGQCGTVPGGRVAAEEQPELSIQLMANPLEGGQLRARVLGAGGQRLTVELVDMRGHAVQQQSWEQAAGEQWVDWTIDAQPSGLYVLRAVSNGRQQSIKVLKKE